MFIENLSRKAATNLSLGLISAIAILPMQATASYAQPVVDSLVSPTVAKQVERQTPARRPNPQLEKAPTSPPARTPAGNDDGPVYNGNGCPEGTILVMFDMPIYDDDGLFVVGYEPTPICIDEDTVPAG